MYRHGLFFTSEKEGPSPLLTVLVFLQGCSMCIRPFFSSDETRPPFPPLLPHPLCVFFGDKGHFFFSLTIASHPLSLSLRRVGVRDKSPSPPLFSFALNPHLGIRLRAYMIAGFWRGRSWDCRSFSTKTRPRRDVLPATCSSRRGATHRTLLLFSSFEPTGAFPPFSRSPIAQCTPSPSLISLRALKDVFFFKISLTFQEGDLFSPNRVPPLHPPFCSIGFFFLMDQISVPLDAILRFFSAW